MDSSLRIAQRAFQMGEINRETLASQEVRSGIITPAQYNRFITLTYDSLFSRIELFTLAWTYDLNLMLYEREANDWTERVKDIITGAFDNVCKFLLTQNKKFAKEAYRVQIMLPPPGQYVWKLCYMWFSPHFCEAFIAPGGEDDKARRISNLCYYRDELVARQNMVTKNQILDIAREAIFKWPAYISEI